MREAAWQNEKHFNGCTLAVCFCCSSEAQHELFLVIINQHAILERDAAAMLCYPGLRPLVASTCLFLFLACLPAERWVACWVDVGALL
jgi:hypothetical protein